ncbi:MAG: hypothetical protein P4M15_08785 [Alphaproteobacteria bacterium]|nr:hypothetical protein [Alphaproteobacteria bacterium]
MNQHFSAAADHVARRLWQGQIVSYRDPESGEVGLGAVLTSDEQTRSHQGSSLDSQRVTICPITRNANSKWSIRTGAGNMRADMIHTIGTSLWQVQPAEGMTGLREADIEKIIGHFSELTYPTRENMNSWERRETNFTYGALNWSRRAFVERRDVKRGSYLSLVSEPTPEGFFISIRTTTQKHQNDPHFICADKVMQREVLFNCSDVYLIHRSQFTDLEGWAHRYVLPAIAMTALSTFDDDVYHAFDACPPATGVKGRAATQTPRPH